MEAIEILIEVKNGTISCSPRGGHVRARQGAALTWKSAHEQFVLGFELLDGSGTRAWPFVEAQPNAPVLSFRGTLKPFAGEAPAYKYTVAIGRYQLDPIIIVDP